MMEIESRKIIENTSQLFASGFQSFRGSFVDVCVP